MKPIFSFLYFFIPVLLFAQEKQENSIGKFNPTYQKPFTQNLTHYPYAWEYWNKGYLKGKAPQFPKHLSEFESYEFFFIPNIMQGRSSLSLKIEFDRPEKAIDYWKKVSKNANVLVEFSGFEAYQNSKYCYPKGLGFKSGYFFDKDCVIMLIGATKCVGQGEKLGGILSGIAIDKLKKTIILRASEMTL